MKGHLEIFEHRLLAMAEKFAGVEKLNLQQEFLNFEQELGNSIPFYDVMSGVTLADYYSSNWSRFIKNKLK